ncbi:Carboxypeptidase regulatory-like domain-containing protein [Bryocella elongata]|uniref:Carboxypeptidase regulatory-like domain-containing protein n=1 Tax=Bryocella elongata TaxID=863522 RepID=A0A1H5TZ66_9BACT|nr:TonB-dependent receptor [Bryocella elongata]SEF67478.1 Carboxypeptidase regulatory-like domain-containing protein [Bryocella elongata]
MRANRVILSSLLLFAPTLLVAQTPDTATLRGRVLDPSKALVGGVSVSVRNTSTGLTRTVTSDAHGEFAVEALPVSGEYDVTTMKDGFAAGHLEHVQLAGGSTARVDIRLDVSAASSTVTVEGAAQDVNLTEPSSGIRLSFQQIEETPLLNRRITFLPLLNAANRPAINQGDIFMNQNLFTTNGGGRRQQAYVVDGANGNDSWGRQTIFTNIPEDAVAEMSVLTQSFSAEYGSSTGSVVNLVTRSGTDKLHGSVTELYRPTQGEASLAGFTAASVTSGNQVTSDQLAQTAATLSGKLLKNDPTYFFFAGEWGQQRRTSPVLSAIDPVNFIGHYRDLLGSLRLDRQFSPSNNAFLRIGSDGFYDTNPNGIVGGQTLPSVARTFHRKTYTVEAGDTAILSPHIVNNARVQFQLGSPITEFDPVSLATQYSMAIAGGPTYTAGTSQSALLMNRQYGVDETLSMVFGKHQIAAGGDWLLAHTGGNSKEFGGPYFLGRFVFNTCPAQSGLTAAQLITYCETTWLNNFANVASYTQGFGNPSYTVNDNLFAVFAQDNYHLSRKLTLNLGVRYEDQTFTDQRTNFAPRVGFLYDPFGNGGTVVRGGFGMYYSQVVDNSQANYVLSGPGYINYTATPGQPGFPTSFGAAPLSSLASGVSVPGRTLYIRPGNSAYLDQFFPTSTLVNYPSKLLNPYSEQYDFGVEQKLTSRTILDIDYVGTHQLHGIRPLDVDAPTSFIRTAQNQTRSAAAANCTRPYWVYYYKQEGLTCTAPSAASTQPQYATIQSDVNNGYVHYDSLNVNLKHNFGTRGMLLASYVWSHTIDNVDPDTTAQNPNDALQTGAAEKGNAIYDQRNRGVVSGYYVAPLKIQMGGILTLGGGLPYNLVTGTTNSGDTGGTTDRPVINGVVVGRDTGRGTPIYSFDPFLAREFSIFERVKLNLRAEAFNAANHANYVGFINTYGNGAAPATLGKPSGAGLTAQLPARELQFEARVSF